MLFTTIVLTFTALLAAASPIEKRAISQTTFDNLVRYTRYSSGAYFATCPNPEGNTLVTEFSSAATNTQGYIARDDTRKEIVVVFRGSQQIQDFLTDALLILIPFVSPGVTSNGGAFVHTGFLTGWNSVASSVIATVRSQLAAHPGYTIVSTGHSLGASLASLASVSLKETFGGNVQLYTFGQPRTGNPAYAALVDNTIGVSNSFRGVHTTDGVPTIIPTALGYRHHSTEFWNFADPASTATTKQCSGDEDPTCSASIPSGGINAAHLLYFNQPIGIGGDPAVCQSASG